MSSSFQLCPTHLSSGEKNLSRPRAALCLSKTNFWKEFKSSSFSLLLFNKIFKGLKVPTLFSYCVQKPWTGRLTYKNTSCACGVNKLMKCLFKSLGQKSKVRKCPSVCLEIRFFYTLTCVAIVLQSLHLPRQAKPFPANSVKSPSNKEKR